MKKLQLPKLKIRIKPGWILLAVLLVALALEAAALYKYLYLNPRQAPAPVMTQQEAESPRVNLPVYQNAVQWLDENAKFTVPNYQLEKETTGRDNPFTEY